MNAVHHVGENDVIVGNGQCEPAPCVHTQLAGMETLTTYWQCSPAESHAIAHGALIRVEVYGHSMPPIAVGVDGVQP